jgi:hypothetical protein
MDDIETGGPAFPSPTDGMLDNWGMSLRDYFAAKVMQALLSSCDLTKHGYTTELDRRAAQSYMTADAMLKARKGGAA